MQALSIWQPWATCAGLGIKRFETRSWWTSYRGPLAVHASKRWNRTLRQRVRELQHLGVDIPIDLPLGAIVAVVELVGCHEMTEQLVAEQPDLERELGWWSPGRWAWRFVGARILTEPIPLAGQQGLWTLRPDVVQHVEKKCGFLSTSTAP